MQTDRIAALLAPFLGGAALTGEQLSQIATYLDLLLRWNSRMNLTSVRDPEQMVTRHFGESLFAARHLYPTDWKLETGNWKLLDIGSGAGFPGLPIKIWAPALRLTLLESNQRKATFLREVVRALQFAGVEVLAIRAEDYAMETSNREPVISHCTVTLRAVERFDHVLPIAVRLLENSSARTRRLALFIGDAQVQRARELAPTLSWSDALPVPESAHRTLLVGNLQ